MKIIKKYWWVIIVFIVSFCFLEFNGFIHNYSDPLAMYSHSFSLVKGKLPYLDFNIIVPPVFIFYMSIFLCIFNNYISFLMGQALLITIIFVFLYKMYGKKTFILLLVTVIFQYVNIIPTYNFMCFFFLIVIIYLEKYHNNKNILIGFMIGMAFLTKQTVGVFFIIPSLIFYFKNRDILKSRFIGFMIPCFIFFIYLVINNILGNFIDLCFLGLFDFSKRNGIGAGNVRIIYLISSIIIFISSVIITYKNKKDIRNYYLTLGIFFVIPLFDLYHFSILVNCFIIMLFPLIHINDKYIVSLVFSISIPIIIIFSYMWLCCGLVFSKDLKHLNYNLQLRDNYSEIKRDFSFFDKYKNSVILGFPSIYYKICNDRSVDYFDVFLYGNSGYNTVSKLKNKINKRHNTYFIINMNEIKTKYKYSQFCSEVAEYIINNYEKVDSKYNFNVYYKK